MVPQSSFEEWNVHTHQRRFKNYCSYRVANSQFQIASDFREALTTLAPIVSTMTLLVDVLQAAAATVRVRVKGWCLIGSLTSRGQWRSWGRYWSWQQIKLRKNHVVAFASCKLCRRALQFA